MQRGEIWWADFPKPVGRRPVLLLSRDKAIEVRKFVTVADIIATIRNIPVEVILDKDNGMPKKCVVNLDVVNTVPQRLLVKYICKLSKEKLLQVEYALKFALGIDM